MWEWEDGFCSRRPHRRITSCACDPTRRPSLRRSLRRSAQLRPPLILSFGHFITLITDRLSCHASIVVSAFHHPTACWEKSRRGAIDCHLATHSPLHHNKQPDDFLFAVRTNLITCIPTLLTAGTFPFLPLAAFFSHPFSPADRKRVCSEGSKNNSTFQPPAARHTSPKSGSRWTSLT